MTNKEAVNWIINLSADIGKQQHQDLWHYEQALAEIKDMLEAEPERKTGKWIYLGDGYLCPWSCSACGSCTEDRTDYCSDCGAKMEAQDETD